MFVMEKRPSDQVTLHLGRRGTSTACGWIKKVDENVM